MQRARNHGFISGKQDVSDSEDSREALSLSTVECIVLLTLWFIILSCLGRGNTRPSHNILLNRSIVHAIRLHVSEVPCSGAVSAYTTHVPRSSPTEPRSGPPLPTEPGPAKRTAGTFFFFIRVSYFNHAANLLKYFDKLLKKINK